jgi:hypothetical protein
MCTPLSGLLQKKNGTRREISIEDENFLASSRSVPLIDFTGKTTMIASEKTGTHLAPAPFPWGRNQHPLCKQVPFSPRDAKTMRRAW